MADKKQRRKLLYTRINARVKRLLPAQDDTTSRRLADRLIFPERPVQLWAKARRFAQQPFQKPEGRRLGPAVALNSAYIRWLRNQSMLRTAEKQALKYAGKATMWQNPYAKPRPKAALKMSNVWYTAYPASIITQGNDSILTTLGRDDLWQAFEEIGITGLHTGPMKYAGGVDGWDFTPSVDGHFDRISNKIDRLFGNETEFRRLTEAASRHNSVIIDDLIPGHTGKGFDFRLAEMNYGTYPGIYHMIEIPPDDWHLLPTVPADQDCINLSPATEAELKRHGYIIGNASRVLFYEPGIKETNWSVTPPIKGVDGIKRRWVYLHFWKQGQPSINWLDPSFSGMKLVIGDALHSIDQLGSRGLRLDANGLLGIEKTSDDTPAWSEGHPLSEAANHIIAGSVRKVGGFTFQEFNVQFDDMQAMSSSGADLSYDFVTRPAYHHALAVGDVSFLRLMLLEAQRYDIRPVTMVHAMQNHDELTYELVHFGSMHKDDLFDYKGKQIRGQDLRTHIQEELRQILIGTNEQPYNLAYTENGIACTTASAIAAIIGVEKLNKITPKQIETIRRMHLVLAMFNALQPGVFAISGWDLRGVLPLDPLHISNLLETGDTRWINRGAYDMMGVNPHATESLSGMPTAPCLYAALPDQLTDPHSFATQLKRILAVRETQELSLGRLADIPVASDTSVLVLVHQLPSSDMQTTVLNFSGKAVTCRFTSPHLPIDTEAIDALTEESHGTVTNSHSLKLHLKPYQGMSLQFYPIK